MLIIAIIVMGAFFYGLVALIGGLLNLKDGKPFFHVGPYKGDGPGGIGGNPRPY